jgi:hypothetical protein
MKEEERREIIRHPSKRRRTLHGMGPYFVPAREAVLS